jgi:hypothetical protein
MEYFKNAVSPIINNPMLSRYGKIISQVWERYDGSGYYSRLTMNDISKESQIIAISHIYLNMTYRALPESIELLKEKGVISQSPDTTRKRHDAAVKFLFKRAAWFYHDVFYAFHDIIKQKRSNEFIPPDVTLEIALSHWKENDEIRKEDVMFEDATIDNDVQVDPDYIENNQAAGAVKDVEVPLIVLEPGILKLKRHILPY